MPSDRVTLLLEASGSISTMRMPIFLAAFACSAAAHAQPAATLDLATLATDEGVLRRVYGSTGIGRLGVPVAGGPDVDGDGRADYAVAYFTADPLDRANAGEIDLIFGDGRIRGVLDTAVDSPAFLRIAGVGLQETAGNEIWMDDVTGDGLGDLLIGRQNTTPDASRIGAGALTIVVGSPRLRTLARDPGFLDLASPPDGLAVVTIVGAAETDRMGIWMRTGDVDGDGVGDVVVAADQEDLGGEDNRGAVYLIRGGAHLAEGLTADLASFGSTPLAGRIAKLTPPPGSERYHFGSTCLIADLDGNGRGEVLASAALARSGASVLAAGAPRFSAEAEGGSPQGTVFILWDDNFPPGPWPPGFTLGFSELPAGRRTTLVGGRLHRKFGEELLGGLDYDGDGDADLFVGDLLGGLQDRVGPGIGHVFYDAAALKGQELDLDDLPAEIRTTTILGPSDEAIASDTAAHGDFDGDGFADLAVAAPYAHPQGRFQAGVVHVFYGRPGGWPELVDTAPERQPRREDVRFAELQGGHGGEGADQGDTLGYSAAAADIDGDGRTDFLVNEMKGNGLRHDAVDVGNLILVGGAALSSQCRDEPTVLCLNRERFAVEIAWRDFRGQTGLGRVAPPESADSGLFWFFSADNWEVLVKVLDGCSVNGRYWVFAAATTNVEYSLRVTDTLTGEAASYFNPLGRSAEAITDTSALAVCP